MTPASSPAPRVSVLTAVHDPERSHLEACLASVRDQTLTEWQHVLVDDGSRAPHVAELLADAERDPRVVVIRRPDSGGIVAASRDALAAATAEFVALLDHDDVLEPTALATMVGALDGRGDVAYSDHDLIRPDGRPGRGYFKPDFSPEQLRSHNYILHLVLARRALVDRVGGFRDGFDGAQDHDLLLRLSEHTDRVVHVPEVLYHWRQAASSVAADPAAKPWAYDAGVRAVQEHCDRSGIDATVEPGVVPGTYRVARRLVDAPRVSVVIPTRGTSRRVWGVTRCFVVEAVRSLVEHSTYPDLEFVVVYDTPTPRAVLDHLRMVAGERLRLVEFGEAFNFSTKINVGVEAASGELVLILNDDTELIEPTSVETMAALLGDDSVGMVGPKLLFADGTVQDAGHVYHEHVLPGFVGWHGTSPGPGQLRPLAVEREVSGVTAAAAMMRRSVYTEVGGMDPALWMNFNDVDLSLKVRRSGRRIVWTPHARWYHFESQTRPPTAEPEEFAEIDRRWHHELNHDPYGNPNFLERRSDGLERPWRSGVPDVDPEDADRSTLRWMLDVLARDVSRRRPWTALVKFRIPVLTVALVVAAIVAGSATGVGRGVVSRAWTTILPALIWGGLNMAAVVRRRWALAAGLVVAAGPMALAHLADATSVGPAWASALVGGVVVGPLWRRRRPVAVVISLAVVAIGLLAWLDTGPERNGDAALVFARGGASTFGGAAAWAIALAIFLWAMAGVALLVVAWSDGERRMVAWSVVALVAIGLASVGAERLRHTSGAVALVAFVIVALSARVDHAAPAARSVLAASVGSVAAGWALVVAGLADTGGYRSPVVGWAVAVALASVGLAVAWALTVDRRPRIDALER